MVEAWQVGSDAPHIHFNAFVHSLDIDDIAVSGTGLGDLICGGIGDDALDGAGGSDAISGGEGDARSDLSFIGEAAFSGNGTPEVREVFTAAGATIVLVDPTGNGDADVVIRLLGHIDLTAGDFVL